VSLRMRSSISLAAIFALLVAMIAVTPAAPVTAQEDVCPPADRVVDPDDPAIIVDTPEAGGSIASPATVQGTARVFEANVRIRIYDADGNMLADTFTTAEEAGPAMAPFATSVDFTEPASTQAGCVWVFEESAEDGEPIHVVAIPVTIEVDAEPEPADPEPEPDAPVTPAPSDTGSAGLSGSTGTTTASAVALLAGLAVALAALRRRVAP
jgi:hypothetical protein